MIHAPLSKCWRLKNLILIRLCMRQVPNINEVNNLYSSYFHIVSSEEMQVKHLTGENKYKNSNLIFS